MTEEAEKKVYPYEIPRAENITYHPSRGKMDLPASDVLRAAYEAELTDIVVIGRRPNGKDYLATNMVGVAAAMYYTQRAQYILNELADQMQADIDPVGEDPDDVA